MKLREKEQARSLRKEGYSLKEIVEELHVAKSSASLWVRDIKLSRIAKERLKEKQSSGQRIASAAHHKNTKKKLVNARQQAEGILTKVDMDKSELRVLLSMIYWCEGNKTVNDSTFAFTNSDPRLIATFLYLLRTSFNIDESKLRAHVHIHEYHDYDTQLNFWSHVTKIPKQQFTKPHLKSNTKKRIRDNYQGCLRIVYYDVILSRLIQALAREVMSKYS